ncbi:hypothetical protein KSX_77260 [Ktedonospora formicarum]|uniref:Uncharacterized protein n=1 Tax=Ktedonospora formicarum TaxID=2778364 RepID=A0A8J3IC38_9CHLR|nr:hypothetical protein KSX_77260 [Ktedonospora formicarum]
MLGAQYFIAYLSNPQAASSTVSPDHIIDQYTFMMELRNYELYGITNPAGRCMAAGDHQSWPGLRRDCTVCDRSLTA